MAITNDNLATLLDLDSTLPEVDIALTKYINHATKVYNTLLGTFNNDEASIDLITLYIAGHYYDLAINNGGLVKDKVSDESEQQYRKIASDKIGFMATKYGQEAIVFDASGTLRELSNQYRKNSAVHNVK